MAGEVWVQRSARDPVSAGDAIFKRRRASVRYHARPVRDSFRDRGWSAALLAAGEGVILAILLSSWAATRVTRPVEELARAAREVATGNWNATVNVQTQDEIGELAESFNRMTRDLLDHRERLVQAERV